MASSTYEESKSTANSSGRKFLNNSKNLDVISLLVKYYVPLELINKVIKLLKRLNLQWIFSVFLMEDTIERALLVQIFKRLLW